MNSIRFQFEFTGKSCTKNMPDEFEKLKISAKCQIQRKKPACPNSKKKPEKAHQCYL